MLFITSGVSLSRAETLAADPSVPRLLESDESGVEIRRRAARTA